MMDRSSKAVEPTTKTLNNEGNCPPVQSGEVHTLLRKFAVVKLWPHLKTAEDECIARIKTAASLLNLECLEVDSMARLISPPHTKLTRADIDFVLHLHYETPKSYDIFSFVALWNPIEFYHLWGYRKNSAHLLTHDDFVSCESAAADKHVERMIAKSPMRVGPYFTLHHSVADPILPPTTGEQRLFYVGINWERIQDKNGRHAELLRLLDQDNRISIFGPRIFQGIDVWKGYKNYVGPLPFDGSTIIKKIHQAGVCLCLSSDAHKQSALMSSRLFEGLAAGAVLIVDENDFAHRFFGDTLLYVDSREGTEALHEQICSHLDWIKQNPDEAIRLAAAAQEIFLRRFILTKTLSHLYDGFIERKQHLERLYTPHETIATVTIFCLIPDFSPEVLERHLESCRCQIHQQLDIRLILSEGDWNMFRSRIETRIAESSLPVTVEQAEFYRSTRAGRFARKLGEILADLVSRRGNSEYILFVAPNETLFSDHIASLVRALELKPDSLVAAADALLCHTSGAGSHADLSTAPKCGVLPELFPLGFARLLLRRQAFNADIPNVLSVLDATCNYLIYNLAPVSHSERCTVTIDIHDRFYEHRMDLSYIRKELLYIEDYLRETATTSSTTPPSSAQSAVMQPALSDWQKIQLAADIFHLMPLPQILKRPLLYAYRKWKQRTMLSQ